MALMEKAARARKNAAANASAETVRQWEKTGAIPAKVRRNIDVDHRSVARLTENMAKNPGTYVFLGPYRTGKSTLAASIYTRWTKGHAYWTDTYTMIREIRETLNSKTVWKTPRHSLLVIDEYEKQHATDWVAAEIDRTLRWRHDEEKTTIVISNLEPMELEQNLGGSMLARIQEINGWYAFESPWWK